MLIEYSNTFVTLYFYNNYNPYNKTTTLKTLHSVHPDDFKQYDTALIRDRFLIDNIVKKDTVNCVYTHYDRMIIGAASPVNEQLSLENLYKPSCRILFRAKGNWNYQRWGRG